VRLTTAAVVALAATGFAVVEPEATVRLAADENALVEFAAIKISMRLKGVVSVDSNENGEFDDNRPPERLVIVLDGDGEDPPITDEIGRSPSATFRSARTRSTSKRRAMMASRRGRRRPRPPMGVRPARASGDPEPADRRPDPPCNAGQGGRQLRHLDLRRLRRAKRRPDRSLR